MKTLFLAARAIFFVLLLPGTVAGYLPYRILSATQHLHVHPLTFSSAAAWLLTSAGAVVHLRCVWDFFATGKGTLAPIDPPRYLVITGLYRYTRNPMYNGVLAILLGQAWLFRSSPLLTYAAVVLLFFHLVVLLLEEPMLHAQFGEAYEAYRRSVPRWGFTVHPYRGGTGSTA